MQIPSIHCRVIPKCEGEAIAAKFSCAFCETTAADDYEYVQHLFHRTVREVRKERERIVAAHSIDEESSAATLPINANMTMPSLSSSSSSNSSIHFLTSSTDAEKVTATIPQPPPLPATLTQKSAKLVKLDSQSSMNSSTSNVLHSSTGKASSPARSHHGSQLTPPTPAKRAPSKGSVFSKIFK